MNDRCHLRLPILLVAAVVWSGINGPTGAEESATVPTDPGLNADTGQINPGSTHQASSQSKQTTNIPTPEEARRALLEPYSKQPSLGNAPSAPRPEPKRSADQIQSRNRGTLSEAPKALQQAVPLRTATP